MTIRENYEKWLKDFATDEETVREPFGIPVRSSDRNPIGIP